MNATTRVPPAASAAVAAAVFTVAIPSAEAELMVTQTHIDYRRGAAAHTSSAQTAVGDARVVELIHRWISVTRNMSSLSRMRRVPEFQEVVSAGVDAIPAILGMYKRADAAYLFLMLQTITGENPVSEADYGDPDAIRAAWLRWGNENAPYSG